MMRIVLFSMLAVLTVGCTAKDPFVEAASYADRLQSQIPGTCVAIAQYAGETLQTHTAGECTAKSLYQIASITKVFTGVLLADRVLKGLKITTTIGDLLSSVKFADPRVSAITLLDLATHTSGLPRMPDNVDVDHSDKKDGPLHRYGSEQLLSFLTSHRLRREPGASGEYSNLGMGLLGYFLAKEADKSYADLVKEVVLSPLGMNDTSVTPTDQQSTRITQGYNEKGEPVSAEKFAALAGAGALWSTLDDLQIFLQANLNPPDNAVGAALRLAHEQQRQALGGNIGLAWRIARKSGDAVPEYWHDGKIRGYAGFVGFIPAQSIFNIVLASGSFAEVGPLAGKLMGSRADLPTLGK